MSERLSRGLFVTGTGTGVGKTQVAAALAHLLAGRKLAVRPRKPVESGCRREGNRLVPEDARILLAASQSGEPLQRVCPYPLEPAIAPARAAKLAGQDLTLDDLRTACLDGVEETDFLLVEGAGGFYSPLTPDALNADLAAAVGLPILLVAEDRLGSLNHCLLTLEAIQRRGLTLMGVVLNRKDADLDPRMDNAADLARWLDGPVIATGRFDADTGACGWLALLPALAPLADRLADPCYEADTHGKRR